jgi:hypothetical protein
MSEDEQFWQQQERELAQLRSESKDGGFGLCPMCGEGRSYLNIGPDHWFICEEHKTKWWAGSNLLSAWRQESEDEWRENEKTLAGYREVQPIEPTSTPEQAAEMDLWHEISEEKNRLLRARGYTTLGQMLTLLANEDPVLEEVHKEAMAKFQH